MSAASTSNDACPIQPAYPLPSSPTELQQLLHNLDDAAPRCLRNAPFHAWRGAVLLALAQPTAAIESLERALLIEPDLPGAQLDYAQALLAVGDTLSARSLMQQLQARSDLPAYLAPVLQKELAATKPEAWRTRWLLASALGVDNNLNNAPAASELTLTFPQGPITLPLADSYRPRRGANWLNTLQWQGIKPVGSQLWFLQAEVRTRNTVDNSVTGYQQTDLAAHWLQNPDAPAQWVARAGLSRVDFGGQPLLRSGRFSLQRQWQPLSTGLGWAETPPCRPGAGLEAEQRSYPISTELDGQYLGALLSVNCMGNAPGSAGEGWLSHQQTGLQLRWGQDHASNSSRPGGQYERAEIRMSWEGRRGPTRLYADYGYTRQTDSTGYSPLLSSNLARRTARHALRLEMGHALPPTLGKGVEAFIAYEANAQASNLAAFVTRQQALVGGLRWRLP